MNEHDEYKLHIDAYSPDTIPMERLAMYLAAFSKLLGHPASVHFSRLEGGSTGAVAFVQREDAPKIDERMQSVKIGNAANDAVIGFNAIDTLLRADNAVGELSRREGGQTAFARVITFPGKTAPKVERFGPIVEHLTMDGQIMRLGGKEATAHAQIVTSEGKSENAEMSIEIGKQLRKYLWGKTIRFSGVARWERRDDEIWHLLQYKITSFEPIEDESLAEATKKLRALESSDWSKVQDIDAHICDMRGDSVH